MAPVVSTMPLLVATTLLPTIVRPALVTVIPPLVSTRTRKPKRVPIKSVGRPIKYATKEERDSAKKLQTRESQACDTSGKRKEQKADDHYQVQRDFHQRTAYESQKRWRAKKKESERLERMALIPNTSNIATIMPTPALVPTIPMVMPIMPLPQQTANGGAAYTVMVLTTSTLAP